MTFPVLLAAGLTVASLVTGEKARSEQRKTQQIQQRIQERKELREKQQQLRSSVIQRAQLITAGAAAGVSESSAVEGGAASVQSQAAGNISFLNQISSMNEAVYNTNKKASEYQSITAGLGAAASLSAQFIAPTPPKTG